MALHLHEGQMFRDRLNDAYVLSFPLISADLFRLTPVVRPSTASHSHFRHSVDFFDEVEAGIWVPFDPESTFVGLRPSAESEVIDTMLFNIATELGLDSPWSIEKEVSHE